MPSSAKSSPFWAQAASRASTRHNLKFDAAVLVQVQHQARNVAPAALEAFRDLAYAAFTPNPGPQTDFVNDEDTFEILSGGGR